MNPTPRLAVHVAALAASLALARAAAAQVPGPERIEVLQTDDGPRVLLAGVGIGTSSARAAARLGGGALNAFFGGPGLIFRQGEIDGVPCSLMALMDRFERVDAIFVRCKGGRLALRRLAGRFRDALASLPSEERPDGVSYGGDRIVASVRIVPEDEDGGWWARAFGPRALRVGIRR